MASFAQMYPHLLSIKVEIKKANFFINEIEDFINYLNKFINDNNIKLNRSISHNKTLIKSLLKTFKENKILLNIGYILTKIDFVLDELYEWIIINRKSYKNKDFKKILFDYDDLKKYVFKNINSKVYKEYILIGGI